MNASFTDRPVGGFADRLAALTPSPAMSAASGVNGGSIFPDAKQFVEESRLGQEMKAAKEGMANPIQMSPPSVRQTGVSKEFRSLIVNYAASCLAASTLEEIQWSHLAMRLGTKADWLKEAANQMEAVDGSLWQEVMGERILRAGADKLFRDVSWQRLESKTVGRLLELVSAGLIRDPGELLAIATTAHRANGAAGPNPQAGGNNVNLTLNMAGATPEGELPAAGARISVDLSPRVAQRLGQTPERAASAGTRVIDGEMISANELRSLLEQKAVGPLPVENQEEK